MFRLKWVELKQSDKLSDLTQKVGSQNVGQLLADNGLSRVPNIGQVWHSKCRELENSPDIENNRKINILNQFVSDYDIYEAAALSDSLGWKALDAFKVLPGYLKISDSLESSIPDSYQILGNKKSVPNSIYRKANAQLEQNGKVDPDIFTESSSIHDSRIRDDLARESDPGNPLSWFKIPQNEILLYSSISDNYVSIPAFPEELSDSRVANYAAMPDLLYQYEPWQMYQSSGPKTASYEFNLHRDMWTGDHNDGKANELIRFCQAQCFPNYNGSAVYSSTVSLYISGQNVITGIMNSADVNWYGPLGDDGWYLAFKLTLSITEVSKYPLNYYSVMKKRLIG